MSRILIMEPHLSGHRGPYLRWFVEQFAQIASQVRVATVSDNEDPLQALDIGREGNVRLWFDSRVSSAEILRRGNIFVRQQRYWRLFHRWYTCHSDWCPNLVFLPNADYFMYAVGWKGSPFGSTEWATLGMKETFHFRKLGVIAPSPRLAFLRRFAFSRATKSRTLLAYLSADELLADYMKAERIRFFPELGMGAPSLDRASAKRALGLNPDRNALLVYGNLTERKGIQQLLRGIQAATHRGALQLLLIGSQNSAVRALLQESWAARICSEVDVVAIDRLVSGSEEEAAFAAADCVWLGYVGHYGSSGVLVQAGTTGRPIIACREGIIGWKAHHHGLGPVVDIEDPSQVGAALDHLVSDPAAAETYGRNGAHCFSAYSDAGSRRALREAVSM